MRPPPGAPKWTSGKTLLVIAYLLYRFGLWPWQMSKIADAIDAKLVQMEYIYLPKDDWGIRRKTFLVELRKELYLKAADVFMENMGAEILRRVNVSVSFYHAIT